jgi:hypothetical protein
VKLELAIRQVSEAEAELAQELLAVGERHRTEHDVFHLTRMLAQWSQTNVAALEPFAQRYGAKLDAPQTPDGPRPLSVLREKTAELLGRRPEPGLLLLHDLRRLHSLAGEASINWVILAQGAQAARDVELVAVVSTAHAQNLRVLRWVTQRIKETAPQVLMS